MATRDPTSVYARQVVKGAVPAGPLHRMACERHLLDVERARKKNSLIRFDRDLAARAYTIMLGMRHVKGEWGRDGGQLFRLAPWQEFVIGSLFGWVVLHSKHGWIRRFRKAYIEVPRKNGKTWMAAAIGVLLGFFDDEPGADIFSAATRKEQAREVFDAARLMVLRSQGLRRRIEARKNAIYQAATNSKFIPLSADERTLDGLNPHGLIIDELHKHKTSAVVDVLETGIGARRQPLQVEITTAGFDRLSICYQHHTYSRRVLESAVQGGTIEDDGWFAFIAGIDKEDDWREESSWRKANPNYGVSVNPDTIASDCKRAQAIPSAQNAFKRLRLNVWTEQATLAIPMDKWRNRDGCAAPFDEAILRGQPCYGGLDLAQKMDLTAFALVWPYVIEGHYLIKVWHWLPKETVDYRSEKDMVPYRQWADAGLVGICDGAIIDHRDIYKQVMEAAEAYDIREIAYDTWNIGNLDTTLTEQGATMIQVPQVISRLSLATKEFLGAVVSGTLRHNGDPLLEWQATNLATVDDGAANIKPSKKKSAEKIDGLVAVINAMSRVVVHSEEDGLSPYEEEGIFTV